LGLKSKKVMVNREKIKKLREDIMHKFETLEKIELSDFKDYQHVMLIDNNDIHNILHSSLLENLNLFKQVSILQNPDKAIDLIKETSNYPDIIFINILLSEYAGRDYIKEIKQLSEKTKVIFLSSNAEANSFIDCENISYLSKPLSVNKIYKILENMK
jgi:two-component SAPR family response regulator